MSDAAHTGQATMVDVRAALTSLSARLTGALAGQVQASGKVLQRRQAATEAGDGGDDDVA